MPSKTAARRSEKPLKKALKNSVLAPMWDVPEKNAAQLRFRMLKAQFIRAGSHNYDNIGAWLQLCTMQSKKFANEPLRPIPLNSSPDLSTRRDSKARLAGRSGALEDQEMSARLAASSALDSKKLLARSDAARPCQPKIRTTDVRAWAASSRSNAYDPSPDGVLSPACHPGWPYVHENHGGVAA